MMLGNGCHKWIGHHERNLHPNYSLVYRGGRWVTSPEQSREQIFPRDGDEQSNHQHARPRAPTYYRNGNGRDSRHMLEETSIAWFARSQTITQWKKIQVRLILIRTRFRQLNLLYTTVFDRIKILRNIIFPVAGQLFSLTLQNDHVNSCFSSQHFRLRRFAYKAPSWAFINLAKLIFVSSPNMVILRKWNYVCFDFWRCMYVVE